MKKIHLMSVITILVLLMSAHFASAAFVPATLSYQGSLYNSDDTPYSGVKTLTFSLYTVASSGTAFWTETQTDVNVVNGRFATILGNSVGNTLNPANFTADIYLGVKVAGDLLEMSPRHKLTSVAFAFNATSATSANNGVPVGGIIMWSGTTVPSGWALCDGTNGTPNLQGRFIIGSGTRADSYTGSSYTYTAGSSGGSVDHFHKGFEDGGDLRIPMGMNSADFLVVQGIGTNNNINPNTAAAFSGSYWTQKYSLSGINNAQPATLVVEPPVIGYTSSGFTGKPVFGGNTPAAKPAGSLPPYYVLAYIMRTQ